MRERGRVRGVVCEREGVCVRGSVEEGYSGGTTKET